MDFPKIFKLQKLFLKIMCNLVSNLVCNPSNPKINGIAIMVTISIIFF